MGDFCYNTTHHMSIGMSPFKHCMGMKILPSLIKILDIVGPQRKRVGFNRVNISSKNSIKTYKQIKITRFGCLIWSSLAIALTLKSYGLCFFSSTTSSIPLESFKMKELLTINKEIVVTNNTEYLTIPKYVAH